jgi:uncharacterized protein GlcG (DUF336 family)
MKHATPSSLLKILSFCAVALALLCAFPTRPASTTAETTRKPVLVSEETSTRAVAVDSVTQQREPFAPTSPVEWGADNRTRILLFVMNLSLEPGDGPSALTAEAEDGAHRIYPLTVEYVGPLPEQPWANSVVMRLHDEMGDVGDVLVRLTYHGVSSNRVRVGIGHVGDGPPDDVDAVPTPGSAVPLATPTPGTNATAGTLSASEVQTIITQAVNAAAQSNHPVTISVTDREGNVLSTFAMTGAPANTQLRSTGTPGRGLEGMSVPSSIAAISKAGTGAFFSTGGNAFTTRTAGFIIQEHFPPDIKFRPAGPLYGVQFSSLPCSDIKQPGLPLGLSGDPGGLPVYKNGLAVGGVGIEGDGVYTVDRDPKDSDQPFEEIIAAAAVRGFEAPALIRGDNILVDGIRLPYINVANAPAPASVSPLPGSFLTSPAIRGAQVSAFVPANVGGISGEVDTRFFPFKGAAFPAGPDALAAADVQRIIAQAAQQSNITRAAIRQPLGSNARVSIAVVDAEGNVLGIFRTTDAPVFGFDVSVQKARTAAFYSNRNAASLLRGTGFGAYVDRAAADGLKLDGAVAFTDRAGGFLHRPFFPDGIDETPPGPFSTPISEWSVFNDGLQVDLIKANLVAALGGMSVPCTSIPNLPNGIQIFPGSVPLYKNGVLVGGIGISGDGVDQDDIIAAAGAVGYAPPVAIRSDQIFVRGVRLPFLKFPRSPNL